MVGCEREGQWYLGFLYKNVSLLSGIGAGMSQRATPMTRRSKCEGAVASTTVPSCRGEASHRWKPGCIWQEAKTTHGARHCVCVSICALIDEMNSGSGKLILGIDSCSGCSFSHSPPPLPPSCFTAATRVPPFSSPLIAAEGCTWKTVHTHVFHEVGAT